MIPRLSQREYWQLKKNTLMVINLSGARKHLTPDQERIVQQQPRPVVRAANNRYRGLIDFKSRAAGER